MYVICSLKTGRRYVSHTCDINHRFAEHNNPEHNPVKYTAKCTSPWVLVHREGYTTRSEAITTGAVVRDAGWTSMVLISGLVGRVHLI